MKLQIRETCDIAATGRNLYPFINAIRQSDIACTAQYCSGSVFHCRILRKDLPALTELGKAHGIAIEARERKSLLRKLRRYRLRIGVPLGVLICAGILFYYSNTVVTIEIMGNSSISDSVILAVLESDGVTEGVWIPEINFIRCERKLRAAVPEIAWVGMRHTGNRLVVEISEATPNIEMLHERTPCNIVSLYDAQITDVTVYNGHLARLIGDGVAKGDMLVSGVFEDEKGHVTYHHATASIQGIYTKEAELTEYFTVTQTEKTGRTHTSKHLRIFNLRIPLTFGSHRFTSCTETEADIPFSFLGHELPFGIVQRTYTETSEEIILRTEEETQLALNAAIVRYEKNFLSDVEILERSITYSSDENGMSCHISYTVEGEIGTASDIFVK